jgi:hypothetical protein
VNPRVLQSVRVTARHHALAGQVVRVVRHKRHGGEAYVVVEVEDGSRQLVAARNTELADGQSPAPGLRFTPGSLRALLDVIDDLRRRLERADGTANAPADQPAAVDAVLAADAAAGGAAVDGIARTPASPTRHGRARNGSGR